MTKRAERRDEPLPTERGLFDAPPEPPRAPEPRPAPAEARPSPPPQPPLYTVGQLSAVLQSRFAELGRIRVEGEVSQKKRTASGHVYFDLKDSGAKLACKVWQSKVAQVLRTDPAEGTQVVAWGRLDVYAPQGAYSLIVDRLEPLGIGALLAELERRKVELRARGWFDRRRALPAMPRTIGLVTSRDGAALRDFLRTRSLRWPGYPVRLCHTPVQGPGAAEAVAGAIACLEASGVDVVVVVRGGGSLEDLWTFNELVVAEALWRTRVPVVTGIGHQSDTTLADFVADHRAHTPTDAAQTVIPERAQLCARIARLGHYLVDAMDRRFAVHRERVEALVRRPVLRDADWILVQRRRALEKERTRLAGALAALLQKRSARLAHLGTRLERRSPRAELARRERVFATLRLRLSSSVERRLERSRTALQVVARGLEAVSPLGVLARGYSLTRRASDGTALRDATEVAAGDAIETRLARGSLVARVEEVRPADEGGA